MPRAVRLGFAAAERLGYMKREVTSAISKSHGLSVADLVLVPRGSIPVTTSGKVRRAQCVELYSQDRFVRLDGGKKSVNLELEAKARTLA